VAKRAKVKSRVSKARAVWGPDFQDDPMYPFRGVPLPSETGAPADTTTAKKSGRISWGGLKALYRRKDDE
jgi:hypothetical protein